MWVKWQQWENTGLIGIGEMPLKDVNKHLVKFGKQAAEVLHKTGAAHVLYAIKQYNEDTGGLDMIRFYMKPMSDNEFERCMLFKNSVIYAIHAHK